ncbi:MAG TPA: sigma-70 family RNA polymerase sigma factor [Solirubrobacteraceae bacterium]|jgi:RNA polymerase sigma factor (sigma-70 family)
MLVADRSRTHGRDPSRRTRLPPAAERRLVLAARENAEDRERLIEGFMPLIGSVARLYRGFPTVDHQELMQEGVVGLLRALQRYDPEMGTPFWAYASWWVRQAMQQVVAELTWPVVLSDRALRQLARIKNAQREHMRRSGREPSPGALAAESGMGLAHVQQLLAAERKARGLQEPVGGEGAVGGTFADLLADPRAEDAFDEVPLRSQVGDLPGLLEELSERETAIVRARYGLDGSEHTLSELAGRLGVSAERVRQIEQAALEKMRLAARARALRPALGTR